MFFINSSKTLFWVMPTLKSPHSRIGVSMSGWRFGREVAHGTTHCKRKRRVSRCDIWVNIHGTKHEFHSRVESNFGEANVNYITTAFFIATAVKTSNLTSPISLVHHIWLSTATAIGRQVVARCRFQQIATSPAAFSVSSRLRNALIAVNPYNGFFVAHSSLDRTR
jgi:hypothetical protein